MEEATRNLLDKGEKMAKEAAVLKEELTAALQEVRKEGEYPVPGRSIPHIPRAFGYRSRGWECFVLQA